MNKTNLLLIGAILIIALSAIFSPRQQKESLTKLEQLVHEHNAASELKESTAQQILDYCSGAGIECVLPKVTPSFGGEDTREINYNPKGAKLDKSDKVVVDDLQTTEEEKELMKLICEYGKHNGKVSPLCDNWDLYYKLTEISAQKEVPFRLMVGISFAESKIGTHFAPTEVCGKRNNWGGLKGWKMDDGSMDYGKFPTADGCWLYGFASVEQYWGALANTLRAYEKACGWEAGCISTSYVGGKGVKYDWLSRVKIFYPNK